MERDEIMLKARAFKVIARSARTDEGQAELELRGFMELFHPKLSKNRQFMQEICRPLNPKRLH